MSRTRLAPSPTGALHLGNARTFLINWALARQRGWEIVLRIEDLDGPRVKAEYVEQVIADLQWLGIDWDEGPWRQRHDLVPYRQALQALADQGLVYKCTCTRQQVEAATLSAPHADEHELRYPGSCRPRQPTRLELEPELVGAAYRVRVSQDPIEFGDQLAGPQRFVLSESPGDFLVWTKQGLPSYQLAVVVDDHRQNIEQVVRGNDLLNSAARQLWLYRLLGWTPPRSYTHLPLVVGEDGRRLAKRHGDSRVAAYRQAGVPAERLLGLLARWSGITCDQITAAQFLSDFQSERLPRGPIVFTAADDRWLRQGAAGRGGRSA